METAFEKINLKFFWDLVRFAVVGEIIRIP